jgi:hypothetical protein
MSLTILHEPRPRECVGRFRHASQPEPPLQLLRTLLVVLALAASCARVGTGGSPTTGGSSSAGGSMTSGGGPVREGEARSQLEVRLHPGVCRRRGAGARPQRAVRLHPGVRPVKATVVQLVRLARSVAVVVAVAAGISPTRALVRPWMRRLPVRGRPSPKTLPDAARHPVPTQVPPPSVATPNGP